MPKPILDKDFQKFAVLEYVARQQSRRLMPLSLAFLFLMLVGISTFAITGMAGWPVMIMATVIGGYMALNIGANDVANHMAPAVGSRALTIGVALMLAAICEMAGAVLAGRDVVSTVSSGIIDPSLLVSANDFIIAMLAALLAASLWLNLATYIGAPVSTTHSIVGGVLGAGIALAGLAAADWTVVARIVLSWMVSPIMGGVIAAGFLAYIKFKIIYASDKLEQAQRRVPLLVALMAGAFAVFLVVKGFSQMWDIAFWAALVIGAVVFLLTWAWVQPRIAARINCGDLKDDRSSVGELFTIPVIVGAALLSFAHGSNDVANAIGPVSAIYTTMMQGEMVLYAEAPLWVMVIGGLGLSVGLLLFGPRLIRLVGSKITKLNRIRAFCVTLAAAITVIIASALGIPVSSTHIAIGALFGVGFLREFLASRESFRNVSVKPVKAESGSDFDLEYVEEERYYRDAKHRYLLRRHHAVIIISAWVITVPAAAGLAAILAWTLRALGLTVVE